MVCVWNVYTACIQRFKSVYSLNQPKQAERRWSLWHGCRESGHCHASPSHRPLPACVLASPSLQKVLWASSKTIHAVCACFWLLLRENVYSLSEINVPWGLTQSPGGREIGSPVWVTTDFDQRRVNVIHKVNSFESSEWEIADGWPRSCIGFAKGFFFPP